MLITCPSCASTYDLPADRIGASGRKVRCASCRESWFIASPEEDERPSLEIPVTEIEARPLDATPAGSAQEAAPRTRGKSKAKGKKRSASEAPKRPSRLRALPRVAAILLACAALPGLLAFREKVVAVLPGTATLYGSIGLPVNLVGLNFTGVSSTLFQENDTPILEVSGEIVNDGRAARTVPSLQIALEGEGGQELYRWTAKAAEGELPVGQTAPFRVRLTAPPPGARRVEVTFRDERGRRVAAAH